MSKITFGTDPEMFLISNHTHKAVSALDVIGRQKDDPIKLPNGGCMFADNVLVEAGVPPSDSGVGIIDSIKATLCAIQAELGSNYYMHPQAAWVMDEDTLTHKDAMAIGCTPSYNAWSESANPPGKFESRMRTGSFHIHIGGPMLHKLNDKLLYVKLLDIFLGCSGVIMDQDPTSKDRRVLYGKAGEFRPTSYGLEYRVLSNYFLKSIELTRLVFDIAHWTVTCDKKEAVRLVEKVGFALPQLAINTCDKSIARTVLNNAHFPELMMDRVVKTPIKLGLYESWGINMPAKA